MEEISTLTIEKNKLLAERKEIEAEWYEKLIQFEDYVKIVEYIKEAKQVQEQLKSKSSNNKVEEELNKQNRILRGIHNPSLAKSVVDQEAYYSLLEGNNNFLTKLSDTQKKKFEELAKEQKPKHFMIGCCDSRVPPNELTGTNPGEIFIHRNIANQVIFNDMNCMSSIQYAVEHLKVENIIVMGHTHCGGVLASTNFRSLGLLDFWLDNIRDVANLHKDELAQTKNKEEYIQLLTELNVKEQVLKICATQWVQKAWNDGVNLQIHGWVCHIESGTIQDLRLSYLDWKERENLYKINF